MPVKGHQTNTWSIAKSGQTDTTVKSTNQYISLHLVVIECKVAATQIGCEKISLDLPIIINLHNETAP